MDEEDEEEDEFEEVEPQKANRKLFWAGLISLIIGSQIVALGSFVHNKLGILTTVYVYKDGVTVNSAESYGYLDQITGVIGIVITIIAFILIFIYMNQQRGEEKYQQYLKEKKESQEDDETDEDEEVPEPQMEPVLVQNKPFFWIGLALLLFTGPLGVVFGFAADDPASTAGTAGLASGSTLTIIGFILIFLAVRQALFGANTLEDHAYDYEEDEDESEEEEESENEEDEVGEDLDEELSAYDDLDDEEEE